MGLKLYVVSDSGLWPILDNVGSEGLSARLTTNFLIVAVRSRCLAMHRLEGLYERGKAVLSSLCQSGLA